MPILGLELRRPSLDDVFLNLTGRRPAMKATSRRRLMADGSRAAGPRSRREGAGMSVPWVIADSTVLAKRYLLRYVRVPAFIVFSAIQPVMFVLLFRYVFGGAIKVPNGSYVDFLLPGIIVQTASFTCFGTAIGLADDLKNGLVERFRSLPMSRSAVLLGRLGADTVHSVFSVLLMIAVGYAVGFRIHTNFPSAVLLVPPRDRVRCGDLHGGGVHRADHRGSGDGAVRRADLAVSADLRERGLRSGGLDAGLVAGVRQGEPGDGRLQCPARPDPRAAPLRSCPAVDRLDRRDPVVFVPLAARAYHRAV